VLSCIVALVLFCLLIFPNYALAFFFPHFIDASPEYLDGEVFSTGFAFFPVTICFYPLSRFSFFSFFLAALVF